MAIQSIPRSGGAAGLGALIGGGLGNALSEGIQGLAESKLNAMQEQKTAQDLRNAFPDLSPSEALFISRQPAKQQMEYLQSISSLSQQEESRRNSLENSLKELTDLQKKQQSSFSPYSNEYKGTRLPEYGGINKPLSDSISSIRSMINQPSGKINLTKALASRGSLEDKKLAYKQLSEAYKETKDIRREIFSQKRSANEAIENLKRMDELEKEGLPGAGYVEFLKRSGLDIAALKEGTGEEYQKIADNFIRGAKDVYGGRVTNQELEQFLRTIPSLSNTPDGRKRISANLKRLYNLQVASADAYEEIIKENGGIPPLDLDYQLDKKLDRKREQISKQFREDLSKKVPDAESPYKTAALATAGDIVGGITSGGIKGAAKGAVLGAGWGKYAGGPGAAIGGGLGALAGLTGLI